MEQKSPGHLCSIYCPCCRKVTDKISFNLLREAGKVTAYCPVCQRRTFLEYNGRSAVILHQDDGFEQVWDEMTPAQREDFKGFIQGKKKPEKPPAEKPKKKK
ncbi:MAG: hypothetical protein FWB86_09000 [Treponema sp.]|nr:hypothetical protein [Treponema sp.]MCL2251574.1 hypothetical protein [Treponema sp.]